jgi:hypothetical protein
LFQLYKEHAGGAGGVVAVQGDIYSAVAIGDSDLEADLDVIGEFALLEHVAKAREAAGPGGLLAEGDFAGDCLGVGLGEVVEEGVGLDVGAEFADGEVVDGGHVRGRI